MLTLNCTQDNRISGKSNYNLSCKGLVTRSQKNVFAEEVQVVFSIKEEGVVDIYNSFSKFD